MSERQTKTPTMRDLLGSMKPAMSHPPEREFQTWLRDNDIDPRELEVYDFRQAMMAGAKRDESGHWPSDFKYDFTNDPSMTASDRRTHPDIVVGGFHTKTGQRVPGAPLAGSVDELIRLGWKPDTAQRLWNSVKK